MKRMMRVLAALALCAMLLCPAVYADGLSVTVDVTVTLEGTLPNPAEKFTIVMQPDDPAYPMPEGSSGGLARLVVTGAGEASFAPIAYEKVGIYSYEICQIPGTNEDCTYDARVYEMTVYVTNKQGGGLETTMVLHVGDEADKPDDILFHNKYRIIRPAVTPRPTPTPTGVEDTWPMYMTGCFAMLAIGGVAFYLLTKNRDPEDEFDTVEEE